MVKEIKRSDWKRFCRRFNLENQYRHARITLRDMHQNRETIPLEPFLGIKPSKKGRFINGLQLYTASWDPNNLAIPEVTLPDPDTIQIEKQKNGLSLSLHVKSKNGSELMLEISGDQDRSKAGGVVEKVAYSLYQNRGADNGRDIDDWFEAENRLRFTEESLTT
ncbi:MAG: DUF2934 domain-containing protein [candidate division Zixibacteria bacterium]